MAEKKKMSVAEILAAARKKDSQGGGGPAKPAPSEHVAEAAPAEAAESQAAESQADSAAAPAPEPTAKPAKPKPAAAASGGRPSVSDILAAARAKQGDQAAAAKPAAKAEAKAAPKPAVKPVAGKPAAAKAAEKPAEKPAKAPAAGGAKDTASILAAARTTAKPGPMSKAEAAAKLKPEAPAAAKAKPTAPPMPAKPEYARPKPAKEATAETEPRRWFLSVSSLAFGSFLAIGFTSLAATVSLWTLGMARFMFPNVLIEPPSKFKVGFPSDFAPGVVEEKYKAQFGVWVCKAEYQGQMQIYALRTVCTHLGCTPNWLEAEQKFKCPCHGSGFYKDGINFEGPAPRPLERYAIRMADDGQLEIDKSKMFQEEMGQWKDSASFVPA